MARPADHCEDQLLDTLDAAAATHAGAQLADTPGRYSFCHALIQHTLYEDLGATRRSRTHLRVAEALEELVGDHPGERVAELARHWFNATQPKDLDRLIAYSRQAADLALAALAPGDALDFYQQALDLLAQTTDPDPALRLDLAIGLGTAQRQTGNPDFRQTLLDAAHQAIEHDDTVRLVAAALANNRGMYSSAKGIDVERVEVLQTTLDYLPEEDGNRALVLSTLCAELAIGAPLAERQALADEALLIARSLADGVTLVRVLNNIAFPLLVPHLADRVLANTAEALALARQLGDPVLLFWAVHWRLCAVTLAGDIDERDRCAEVEEQLAGDLDQPTFHWVVGLTRTVRAMMTGDTDESERQATAALTVGIEGGEPDAETVFGLQISGIAGQRGTRPDFTPVIEQMFTDAPYQTGGSLESLLALVYAEAGRLDEAQTLLTRFVAGDLTLLIAPVWSLAMSVFALVAIECDGFGSCRGAARAAGALRLADRGARSFGEPRADRLPGRWPGLHAGSV